MEKTPEKVTKDPNRQERGKKSHVEAQRNNTRR